MYMQYTHGRSADTKSVHIVIVTISHFNDKHSGGLVTICVNVCRQDAQARSSRLDGYVRLSIDYPFLLTTCDPEHKLAVAYVWCRVCVILMINTGHVCPYSKTVSRIRCKVRSADDLK